ncbi:DUF1127 domain-containing protein [Mesorhizobium sp. M0220]|uniref:DUF1127 domain-containing protein n=1 Tax=unclassified Mesorhizobium TaxID=325217 RepID=UPI00333CBD0D
MATGKCPSRHGKFSAFDGIGGALDRIPSSTEQLAELEDHQLADLGLSPAQIRKECAKWPWQA